MTAYETAALLRNWEEAIASVLREILAGSSAPGVTAAPARTGMHNAARDEPQAARPRGGRGRMPTVASPAAQTVALRSSSVAVVTHSGQDGDMGTAPLGTRAGREDGRETTFAVRWSGDGRGVFAEGRGAGYRICARRLHSELCWCRQTPAVSIEWVVDMTGREQVIGRLSLTLALALDGHLPVFAGGLTLQSRFHGLVERREGEASAHERRGDAGGRAMRRLLFSSILIAD